MKKEQILAVVIDGQGGGMGRALVEQLKKNVPGLHVRALGTNAMATAAGNSAGMPKTTERSRGAINPIASPQGQPHIKPHKRAGICMGQSMEPISGI